MRNSQILIDWYGKNMRDLPWRHTKDPYLIWISEIILQQTRVEQGCGYYHRFIQRFPDIKSLASADQEEVLKYWQGLGYYSRARNLHESAKDIMNRFAGAFPEDYEAILSLKGIGEYTAAAIVSFVWNQPYPVIDGNVFRVISRLYSIQTPIDTAEGKNQIKRIAQSLMDPTNAGLHNQAIMEFGALQCTPKHPDCENCPLVTQCLAYASGDVLSLPVKQNRTKVRNRYLNYFFINHNGFTYLRRRSDKDIWEGLYEFPLIETAYATDFQLLQRTEKFRNLFEKTGIPVFSISKTNIKHVLSHQVLYVNFYKVEIESVDKLFNKYIRVPISDINNYPFSQLIHRYLIST